MFICAGCKRSVLKNSPSLLKRVRNRVLRYGESSGLWLNTDLIARLIFKMLPHRPPCRLAMDRTNWKFGETNINVLTLAIVYDGVAFPVLISMLDKRGNSHTQERIVMINRYVQLFGYDAIDCLSADREFAGEHWIEWLNHSRIRYYIRIRENFWTERHNKRFKAFWLFNHLKCGQTEFLYPVCRVNGQFRYLSASKIKHNGIPELQIIISFNKPENAQK
jgi:hypothetical protein